MAAIGRGENPLPDRAILTHPLFCCGLGRDFWTYYRGQLHSFAPQPGVQQRLQHNPHTPGATHACIERRTLSRTVLARADDVNTEKVTHACAPRSEALTHARSPSASQLPAARASPRASAAPPSWLRSAPQPMPTPPHAARPRPAAPSAPEAPLVHVRREPTAAHSARPPSTISGGERAGGGAGPRDGTGGGRKACARRG